jgi:uncharacterized membrane protein YphA (DoxX/SURF4 family)
MIIMWILKVLMAGLFLFAAVKKLTGNPGMIHEFDEVGLGQWFRYVVGLLELAGAGIMLWPRTTSLGAALLLFVDVGAFFAQIVKLHMGWVHTVVVGAMLVATIYLAKRPRD